MKKCEYCGEDMEVRYRSKRFCGSRCRVYYFRDMAKVEALRGEQEVRLKDLVRISERQREDVVRNAFMGTVSSLDEVKAMCPVELQGIERSIWIDEARKLYGV